MSANLRIERDTFGIKKFNKLGGFTGANNFEKLIS